MADPPRRHTSARGFQAALGQAIKVRVARSDRTYNEVMREFYLQRFLARVFADADSRWVLKGGTNLLTRFPDVARHSQDIDLMFRYSPTDVLDAAVTELRHLAGPRPDLDPFTFAIRPRGIITGGAGGVRLTVTVSYGTSTLHQFLIDLVPDLPLTAGLDRHQPQPVVELDAVSELPTFVLMSLPDQVADKVCAMYELYGTTQTPSTRFRDLVDLLIVIRHNTLDATLLTQALDKEAARRPVTLPDQLHTPAPSWSEGYEKEARRSTLPSHLHDLDTALAAAAVCLDPLLKRTQPGGTWDPDQVRWIADENREGDQPGDITPDPGVCRRPRPCRGG